MKNIRDMEEELILKEERVAYWEQYGSILDAKNLDDFRRMKI